MYQGVYICFIGYCQNIIKIILQTENQGKDGLETMEKDQNKRRSETRMLSKIRFNLSSGDIISSSWETIEDQNLGIRINSTPINNLRYADGTVLLTDTSESLQILLSKVVESSEEYWLPLNIKKIDNARNVILKMKRALCDRYLSLKSWLVRCYVLSVLYYGMTWTMKKTYSETREFWIMEV